MFLAFFMSACTGISNEVLNTSSVNLETSNTFISNKDLKSIPYVVGRVPSKGPHEFDVYVKGDIDISQRDYPFFRKSYPVRDEKTKQIIGYELVPVGFGRLLFPGEISTFSVFEYGRYPVEGDILIQGAYK